MLKFLQLKMKDFASTIKFIYSTSPNPPIPCAKIFFTKIVYVFDKL